MKNAICIGGIIKYAIKLSNKAFVKNTSTLSKLSIIRMHVLWRSQFVANLTQDEKQTIKHDDRTQHACTQPQANGHCCKYGGKFRGGKHPLSQGPCAIIVYLHWFYDSSSNIQSVR